jgi:hypothetical protein
MRLMLLQQEPQPQPELQQLQLSLPPEPQLFQPALSRRMPQGKEPYLQSTESPETFS